MIYATALRQRFLVIHVNKVFETLVIVLLALVIGTKTYAIRAPVADGIAMLNLAITLFFLVEVLIRMEAMLEEAGRR